MQLGCFEIQKAVFFFLDIEVYENRIFQFYSTQSTNKQLMLFIYMVFWVVIIDLEYLFYLEFNLDFIQGRFF